MKSSFTDFEPLISAVFEEQIVPTGQKAAQPSLLRSKRAVHSSPEVLVSTDISSTITCQVPRNGLFGVVHGLPKDSQMYWVSTRQYLFLLGPSELLLPPLGEVTAATFVAMISNAGDISVFGAVATSLNTLSILKINTSSRVAAVVATVAMDQRIEHIVVTNEVRVEKPRLELAAIGTSSTSIACINVDLGPQESQVLNPIQFKWFTFPSTTYQKLNFFSRPSVKFYCYDRHRGLISTLDSSNVIRIWQQAKSGVFLPAAIGTYPDPIPALALCPAGDTDDFLLVAINQQGGRDIFLAEPWLEPGEGRSSLNQLRFQRQVLAPEGCNIALEAAYYCEGLTLYVFSGCYVTATVAPSFVEPQFSTHEVVDVTVIDRNGDKTSQIALNDYGVMVVTQNGTVYRLTKRADFEVFADMLLDDPDMAVASVAEGVGAQGTCDYIWALLPEPQAATAAQLLAPPVTNDNIVQLSPFIPVVLSQLEGLVSSCRSVLVSAPDYHERIEALMESWRHFKDNIDLVFDTQGWCETTFVEREVLEIEYQGKRNVVISNRQSVPFSLASSLQGAVLSSLKAATLAAFSQFCLWTSAVEQGILVPADAVDWGTANRCSSQTLRKLCLQVLHADLTVGLQVLKSWLKSLESLRLEGALDDILLSVRILATALQGRCDDALDMLGSYTATFLRINPQTTDILIALMKNHFDFGQELLPKIRFLTSLLAIRDGHEGSRNAKIREELYSMLRACSLADGFEKVIGKVGEWVPLDEVVVLAQFLESFDILDERLITAAKQYQWLRIHRMAALRGYRPTNSPSALVLIALSLPEPERSLQLAALSQADNSLNLQRRLSLLLKGDQNISTVQAQIRLFGIQQQIQKFSHNSEEQNMLTNNSLSPVQLFEHSTLVTDEAQRGHIQVELLGFMPEVEDSTIYETFVQAAETAAGAQEFCNLISLAGAHTFRNRYSILARLLTSRRDAPEIISILCDAPLNDSSPEDLHFDAGRLFQAVVTLMDEIDGEMPPGVVPTIFSAAQTAQSFVDASDERNQCSAILEDRASRVLQAVAFGQVSLPQEDLIELHNVSAMSREGMVSSPGMYTEATMVL